MMTYLEDSRCELSNNLSENSIRPVMVGRRNWLFCDTTDGANASMAVYSLLETARANGLNPYKYMEYILEARPDGRMTDKKLQSGEITDCSFFQYTILFSAYVYQSKKKKKIVTFSHYFFQNLFFVPLNFLSVIN